MTRRTRRNNPREPRSTTTPSRPAGTLAILAIAGLLALAPAGLSATPLASPASEELDTAGTPGLTTSQQTRLDAAHTMVDELKDASSASEDAYERAIRLAQLATRQQATQAGDAWTEDIATPSHALPSEAITALVDGPLITDDATLAQLDITPQPLRSALTSFVDAFNAYENAASLAFADEHAENDLGQVLAARNHLLEASLDLNHALSATDTTAMQSVPVIDEHPTLRIDLTNTDRDYTKNYTLILDVGGSDAYTNNAGGNTFGNCTNPQDAAALFDLDHPNNPGDTDYFSVDRTGKWVGDACGKNGGGWNGAGLLVSGTGSDVYFEIPDPTDEDPADPADFHSGVNGGGDLGTGLLVDIAGDETYQAGSQGTNGGSVGARALLVDAAGSDTYQAGSQATNGGATLGGKAALVDLQGTDLLEVDTYEAGDEGTNGGASGPYALGQLIDLGFSDDTLTAGDNGTNGGAIDGAFGLLFNDNGEDVYTAGNNGTNGGAVDRGAGLLIDQAADDTYIAGINGVNGGATDANSALLDAGGLDTFDEGNNAYDCSEPGNCNVIPKGTTGARIST